MKVKTNVKAGGLVIGNHNQTVVVKTGVKAGLYNNHNQTIVVRTGIKAGGFGNGSNHNQTIAG